MKTFALALFLTLAACAATGPAPHHVRARDLGTQPPQTLAPGTPIIVEFEPGDVIPVDLTIQGDLVGLVETPKLAVVAKRRFFLRIDKDGIRTSSDGKNFDEKVVRPGSFRIGLSVTSAGVRGQIDLVTPQKAP